jgi:hypothetical protein
LTVKILQEMRDDIRGVREDNRALRVDMNRGFEQMNVRFEQANARFEVIETSLRDLAEQMVMMTRAIKVAIEGRSKTDERLDEHERRLAEIERKLG